MKKYFLYKGELEVKYGKIPEGVAEETIAKWLGHGDELNNELIAEFDSREEAVSRFEWEKNHAISERRSGSNGDYCTFEIYTLEAADVDEDGDIEEIIETWHGFQPLEPLE